MRVFYVLVLVVLFFSSPVLAQEGGEPAPKTQGNPSMPCMPGMQMPGCPDTTSKQSGTAVNGDGSTMRMGKTGLLNMQPQTFLQAIALHATSGTSAEPGSTPAPMLMTRKGAWMLMVHANVFVLGDWQSSARGGSKFFSTNWAMPMAQREWGRGIFTVRAMFSLEPATITGRQYPLLFQQGETAYGKPIADGQHPHNLFMELAVLYDLKLSGHALLSFYIAPVGDPALGPTAYPHRASAAENPLAPLGHHQEDSTHIADDVVTAGVAWRIFRVEASGFHGREPGEDRWSINQGGLDSWSTRLTVQPARNWSGQYSYGRLTSPEALFPAENQERITASLMYNRPFENGNLAGTFVWGHTRSISDNQIADSYVGESTARFYTRNYVWTRIESAARTNVLLLGENPLPPGYEEMTIGRVEGYTFGYGHDFDLLPHLASSVGAQLTAYGVPGILHPIYGGHPVGAAVYIRLRPFSGEER